MLRQSIQIWDIIISDLAKTQVTYVRLFSMGNIYFDKRSSMGVANSREIFQHKMNDLFYGFEFIRVYIDYLLILTKVYCKNHIQKLALTINKLKEKGLKYNIEKYFFRKTEMEYLGFWVTRDDIKPIDNKIESITNMAPPTS